MDSPDTAEACVQSALALEQQTAFDEALSLYKRAGQLDNSWSTHCHHVRALYNWGRLADAATVATEYVGSVDPAPGDAYNDLGVIRAEQGDTASAISCFTQALRWPSLSCAPLVLGNLAYVLYLDDRRDECAKACDEALRLDPDEVRAHYILSAVGSDADPAHVRPASSLRECSHAQGFRLLRFEHQPMAKLGARIVGGPDPQVCLLEPVPLARPGTHWGILASWQDEVWCGFSRQGSEGAPESSPVMPLPGDFRMVQRRRWVRVPASGGIARLEVRLWPEGVKPFEIVELVELNLSGGGAAVRTVPELPVHAEVSLCLKLGGQEDIEVAARVVRVGRPEAAKAYSALAFIGLDEKARDSIAYFIHHVQLDRKRGKKV